MDLKTVISPNERVKPITTEISVEGHLIVGGCDTVDLAEKFGTPLWIIDEATARAAAHACLEGLKDYPNARVIYAGKAFLCTAMCRLVDSMNLGLDVVSLGEMHTAAKAEFPPEKTYLHGNNKSQIEIDTALKSGINIVLDSASELDLVQSRAHSLGQIAKVLIRVTPGIEPETHAHIKTGQHDSKFGILLAEVPALAQRISRLKDSVKLLGLHAHIGSQGQDIEPYLSNADVLVGLIEELKRDYDIEIETLDLGGGLGIAYTEEDHPKALFEWSKAIANRVKTLFQKNGLRQPALLLEPGRAIIGTAGVTLYRAGHGKTMGNHTNYLALDGGMADNPRPITYQARYTACLANRATEPETSVPLTLAGKYCESGDIIVKEAYIPAKTGDLIAIFATGAYNYSMASNYNRTPRPACVLVADGAADLIIERETLEDLTRNDHIPKRLASSK